MHKALSKSLKLAGYDLEKNNVCECGARATRQVWVRQFTAQGQERIAVIPLCQECYELMCEIDKGILQAT